MRNRNSLSVTEKLVLAAYSLIGHQSQRFSAEDLVVAAWKQFPDTFGLSGHEDDEGRPKFPDSNRVFAEIMGSKPLRQRGLLRKSGEKVYELTESGVQLAQLLQRRSGSPDEPTKAGMGRQKETELKRLFASKAAAKFRNNRAEDITFYDACVFWGISPMSSAIELQGRVANIEDIVRGSLKAIGNQSATFTHGGTPFGRADLNLLLQIHGQLLQKFKAELEIIHQRKHEHKKGASDA